MKIEFKNHWKRWAKKEIYILQWLKTKVVWTDNCRAFHLTCMNFGVKIYFRKKK